MNYDPVIRGLFSRVKIYTPFLLISFFNLTPSVNNSYRTAYTMSARNRGYDRLQPLIPLKATFDICKHTLRRAQPSQFCLCTLTMFINKSIFVENRVLVEFIYGLRKS